MLHDCDFRPNPLARGRVLYLVFLWVMMAVDTALKAPVMSGPSVWFGQGCAWAFAVACTALVLMPSRATAVEASQGPSEPVWRLPRPSWLVAPGIVVLLLVLTWTAVSLQEEPLSDHVRFPRLLKIQQLEP